MGRRRQLSLSDYVAGVRGGDRAILGRAITLVESRRREHQRLAQQLLVELLPFTGQGRRVGVTGVPGVGKSTFIESLGMRLVDRGHRVAVLAVDPSSAVSGGSILGDKTRMTRLSNEPGAFIRPSPSAGSLGGVTRRTRETLLVCEAAGYDVVLVETVGVGQSETAVSEMVDFFLVLILAGAGDELQGVKRGILELADMLAVNKADGDNTIAAERARQEYEWALHLMRPRNEHWRPPVVTCSGLDGNGLDDLWERIEEHRRVLLDSGDLAARRHRQLLRWTWNMVEDDLMSALRGHPDVAACVPDIERRVLAGATTPTMAAARILEAFGVAADKP